MLIADDFGLGRDHDKVILGLLERGKIDGTSVMIDGDIDPLDIERLRQLRERGAAVGLHLNLTHGFSGSHFHRPLDELLRLCLTGRLPQEAQSAFHGQAETFRTTLGFLPDYYDGHQHCHCFPGLDRIAATLPREHGVWVRVPLPRTWAGRMLNMRAGGPKTVLIMILAHFAARTFRRAGWKTNSDFSGFLPLDRPDAVARWLPRLLSARATGTLMMVHPGSADDRSQCPGHSPQSRVVEAEILSLQA
ncbi:ChbG/HpnK family deacetylase [Shinella sedimenti]|uniref:ChbG/HpnK family deacetylase n=1 Tax=Shinella sedimenti TaxID=2919913 RepID=A0ABT0CHQ1_9HYPH|nr:ChbG/HpnK family deacetylase [Shinella sedimenti]MCJ8148135.1 ChbG/HpnK family deacetylase [Shinella sedimenti]